MQDDQRVFEFLMKQYYIDEPLNIASKRSLPADKDHSGPVQWLKYNLSLLVVKKDDPVIILYTCPISYYDTYRYLYLEMPFVFNNIGPYC